MYGTIDNKQQFLKTDIARQKMMGNRNDKILRLGSLESIIFHEREYI